MGLQTYVFFLFGISIALFFLGYQPLIFTMLQCGSDATTCSPTTNFAYTALNELITSIVTNPLVLGIAGIGVISGVLLGGTFAVVYIIPILMIFVLSNFLLLPTDFLLTSGLPWEINMIILGFMNLMLLMTIISFARGGE
jgi:hypothetical protein